MVFLGGPRQVGKTTLALSLLGPDANESHPAYLNWDATEDRSKILKGQLPSKGNLLVLDEIHKYKPWRNFVKGLYDKHKSTLRILVTGSARLDYYRKGGDSLQGRYHYLRLHPLSLMEIGGAASLKDLSLLLKFGGFPEPFYKGEETFLRRWQLERTERVVREDLRDLENVKELSLIELLAERLPACVGSPISVQSLREDLNVAHESVERWIKVLERLYFCFRIPPYGPPRIRAVKKEQKLYMWDWSLVEEEGARFENLVASQLLKYCHFRQDTEGHKMELRYIRDRNGREVDFVVLKKGKALFAVECKINSKTASPHCAYFRQRTDIPSFYQVHIDEGDFGRAETDTRVLPFALFCRELCLP
ncbi:MAG: ATP-binding protein [Deltaproteobacteria bacterium]|nr:ATP-binding protein [Deltaproteobacteria bacterium]